METSRIAAISRTPENPGAYKYLPFTINTLCGPISGPRAGLHHLRARVGLSDDPEDLLLLLVH